MIYLVRKNDNHILDRIDAWAVGGQDQMRKVAKMLGYVITKIEITFNGDMVMWCE